MSVEPAATIALQTYKERFASLSFVQPEAGILEIVISNPKHLNAADARMHRDLASVWREIDVDDAVSAVLVRGDGDHFSSGGDFSLIEKMIADDATLIRVWKEASDLVYNLINCSKPVVSAGKLLTKRREKTRYPDNKSEMRFPKNAATSPVSSRLPRT